VLGAGRDTSYFRYRSRLLHGVERDEIGGGGGGDSQSLPRRPLVRWYDVDHDAVIRDKVATISREPVFESRLVPRSERSYECTWNRAGAPAAGAAAEGKDRYFLLSFDLRQNPTNLRDELVQLEFDTSIPTLFLSECLQMYLPNAESTSLLRGISTTLAPTCAYLAMYEPILGDDAFGRVMETNLLGAKMVEHDSCLIQTRSLSQHLSKLAESGFCYATGCDMWAAYETVLSADQRHKANRCEFLDELEEFVLIMKHYCLVVASNDRRGDGHAAAFCSVGSASPMGFDASRCESVGAS
jgi:Leucine carboxyl methyltransferase